MRGRVKICTDFCKEIQKELDKESDYENFIVVCMPYILSHTAKTELRCPPNKRIVFTKEISKGYNRQNTYIFVICIDNRKLKEDFIQWLFSGQHGFLITLLEPPKKDTLLFDFMLVYYPEEFI